MPAHRLKVVIETPFEHQKIGTDELYRNAETDRLKMRFLEQRLLLRRILGNVS